MRKFTSLLILSSIVCFISCSPSSKEVPDNSNNADSTSGVSYEKINPYSHKKYDVEFSNLTSGGVAIKIMDSNEIKIYSHDYNLPLVPIPSNATSVGGSAPLSAWISSNQLLIFTTSSAIVNNIQIYPKYELLSIVNVDQKTNTDFMVTTQNENDSDIIGFPNIWYNNSLLVPIQIGNTYSLLSYDYSFKILNAAYNTDLNSFMDAFTGKSIPLSYTTFIDYYYYPTAVTKYNLDGQRIWGSSIPINRIPLNVQSFDSLTSQIDKNTVILKAKYTLKSGQDTAINFIIDTASGEIN